MKYIRTKDGIYQDSVPNQEKEREILLRCYQNDFGKCKIADTIEELCDELVVHNPNNDNEFHPQWSVYLNGWKNRLIEIYGAIWTDKGLIYVAKMNEKGVLELL